MIWNQPISEEIFKDKYCLNGENSYVEVFNGVAEEVASAEKEENKNKWEDVFFKELDEGKFIPGGRILANARPYSKLKNYNNCYTIDIEDSMEGIYTSLYEDAQISKSGGGVGFNISKIRPKGDKISKGGESSGPISFLKVFNESAKIIMTGGNRRAAHIAIMNIDHPDIEEFITVKKGSANNELTQFNISVGITNAFMEAVEFDDDWTLQWEGKGYKSLKARYLYDLLAKNAYEHNEPGVFFLDTAEKYNNGFWAFKMDRTNPCGEVCMPSYSLCCLGALNYTKFVINPFTKDVSIDWEKYKESIYNGIRFLDNVLDVTDYPLQKIKDFSLQWRRVGLGFTGLADMFVMMGIVYGSEESVELSSILGRYLRDHSYRASIELAKEKGSFPAFDRDKIMESNFIKQLPEDIKEDIYKYGLRNVALNTCAPTGTISLTVGNNCSSGIEPIFSISYDRNIRTGRGDETKKETVYDYAFLEWQKYASTHEIEAENAPSVFVTTLDIDPYRAIDVQAAFQKYIDHSISKTANLPLGYSYEDYKGLWTYAYKAGLKGFTSFNPQGSIKGILEHKKEEKEETIPIIDRHHAPKRPVELPCDIHEITVDKNKFVVAIGTYFGSLYEVFLIDNNEGIIDIEKHKQGMIKKQGKGLYDLIVKNGEDKVLIEDISKFSGGMYGSLSRMVSMALRHGTPLEFVVETLQKSMGFNRFEKVVARVLKKYIKDGEKVLVSEKCPQCGSDLIFQDGCKQCPNDGWSKCS
jgi:ribonucleoside-diphosphate reductase alpha chain